MNKVSCHYCGLPFKVVRARPDREYFCCAGCALASRVPVDANGRFPASPALVTALATGFVFFNQMLFWLFAVLLAREGRLPQSGRFAMASLAVGAVVWGALVVMQWRLGARRRSDILVTVLTAALMACGVAAGSPPCALAANAALLAWSARGFLKKKTPGKPAVDG